MQTAQELAPRYTISPIALKWIKKHSNSFLRLPSAEDLIPPTKAERKAQRLHEIREEQRMKNEAWGEWNSPGTREFKRLASKLSAKVYAGTSKDDEKHGEYILWRNSDPWILSNKRRAFVEACVAKNTSQQGINAVILIDIRKANNIIRDGVAGTIAHEIGHHIFTLVNARKKRWNKTRAPKPNVLAAFHREGFYASPETEQEIVAETLGQYLRGHKLNPVLLSEVKEILSTKPRRNVLPPNVHEYIVTVLEQFRLRQIAKMTVAAKHERKRIAA